MNPLRHLLRTPESASAARRQEEALALRAYEALVAWQGFRTKHWQLLEPSPTARGDKV